MVKDAEYEEAEQTVQAFDMGFIRSEKTVAYFWPLKEFEKTMKREAKPHEKVWHTHNGIREQGVFRDPSKGLPANGSGCEVKSCIKVLLQSPLVWVSLPAARLHHNAGVNTCGPMELLSKVSCCANWYILMGSSG